MEILVGLGALVFLVVWFSSRKKNDGWVEPRKSPPIHKPNNPSVQKPTTPKRPIFDNETARPTLTETVLVGPAYVLDGDTIVIRKTQIRLFGIDAPELEHPFGQKSKWAMVNICKGKTINVKARRSVRRSQKKTPTTAPLQNATCQMDVICLLRW